MPDQAAALMHSLARNHSPVDDNERLAWSATRVFCLLNDTDLIVDVDDAEQMILAVVIDQHLRWRRTVRAT